EIEAHLVAEHAARAGAGTVAFGNAVLIYMAEKIFVMRADRARGVHGVDYLQRRTTRPGFIRLCGSSARLIARIISRATGDLCCSSLSTLRLPMPCSAEMEPPKRWTESKTSVLTF